MRMINEEAKKKRFDSYVEKYGLDNAQYLVEMESQWATNYNSMALIDLGSGTREIYRNFTQQVAKCCG